MDWIFTTEETFEDIPALPSRCGAGCGGMIVIHANDAEGKASGACADCSWSFRLEPVPCEVLSS